MPNLPLVVTVLIGLLLAGLLLSWALMVFDAYRKARAYGVRRSTSLLHAVFSPILGRP